jgi:hypothetical protein
MRPPRWTTRLRSRLSGPQLLAASAVALVALAASGFTLADGLVAAGSGSSDVALDAGPEPALAELERMRTKLKRARTKIERARTDARQIQAKLERTSRQSARQARRLGKIRDAAGGQLPLTDDPCAVNLTLAASRGLRVPGAYSMHCPGPGLDWNGASHWGVTCPYIECPEGKGPYISISNPTYYVVAHELCHAVFGYGGGAEEALADSCAAEHGASLATSPYR